MTPTRQQVGWWHPDSKRFVYLDVQEEWPKDGYTVPVFVGDRLASVTCPDKDCEGGTYWNPVAGQMLTEALQETSFGRWLP